jgi:acetyl coenzyme A synthetase (ADP forming)-like protein
VNVALRDGSTLRIRPVLADDRERIRAFLDQLSLESIAFRFFGVANLDWVSNWSVDVDYADRYALVASAGPDQGIVAHSAYARTSADRAEVAFMVSDAWQGHGIATIMLAHLAAVAHDHGIEVFTAQVRRENHRMVDVFRDSGFPVVQRVESDTIEIELPTSLSTQAEQRFEQREQTAAVAAMRSFLEPRSVAVVGASRRRRTVGSTILRNLLAGGFTGHVYPVNHNAKTVQGARAYASVGDLPDTVELAVLAVPAPDVCEVARECASAGVRALLVISAGFSEIGGEGAERQAELLAICRQAGMRLIGPNCLGVFNTAGEISLDATFAERAPLPGRVGFLSQSGGLGIAVIEAAERLALGLSSFVSVGNKADISGNDLLEYWEHDPSTDVLLLYLESFGNPRRFARIARRVGASKPIVAVKSGRSPAGARATSSHTGALISASDVRVDALFQQAGVIRTDTMHELFDVGALLAAQPLPRGNRVAIVTNAGGPGILCADACQAGGLEVVELAPPLRSKLAGFLATEASLGNPIDMVATAPAEHYRQTIEALAAARAVDAIVAIFVPPLVTVAHDVAAEIHRAGARAEGVTLTAVFMTSEGAPQGLAAKGVRVPAFDFPEDAARALAHAARYARWRARPAGSVPQLEGCRAGEASTLIAGALAAGVEWLDFAQIATLFDCYGLPLVPTRLVSDADRAAEAGVELLMGVVHDESFGAVIACGVGGTSAELLKDVAVRITPLTDLDAQQMLRSLRTFPLLDGYRGAPACDIASVQDVLLRLSALVDAHPEIAELDANPVLARPDGALILDARVRLRAAPPRQPLPSLRS